MIISRLSPRICPKTKVLGDSVWSNDDVIASMKTNWICSNGSWVRFPKPISSSLLPFWRGSVHCIASWECRDISCPKDLIFWGNGRSLRWIFPANPSRTKLIMFCLHCAESTDLTRDCMHEQILNAQQTTRLSGKGNNWLFTAISSLKTQSESPLNWMCLRSTAVLNESWRASSIHIYGTLWFELAGSSYHRYFQCLIPMVPS